ncbi:MAG: tetratricopeptide repeat protein [Endomicrobia bacterium]|nr:tetratricopeptide repeat protein [Endomicrobiia bacterium]
MRSASTHKKSMLDRISDFLTKQIRENRTRFFTVIGFIAGIAILGIFIFARMQTLNESASDRLSAAYMSMMYGNKDDAVNHINHSIAYSGNTPASYQARLLKADLLMEDKDYDKALSLLKETEAKGNPELIRPLAMSRIIYLYDQQKDYRNAILSSNEFITKYQDNFLIRDVYFNLARYYQAVNSPDDAERVYTEILAKFPATEEAERAEKILLGLN